MVCQSRKTFVGILDYAPVGLINVRQKRESTLSTFPRIAVIHDPKSALHSPLTPRMGLVHHPFSSRGCFALHENPQSDRLLTGKYKKPVSSCQEETGSGWSDHHQAISLITFC